MLTQSDPKYWGPHAWKFLHSITESYPIDPTEEYKNKAKQFFLLLGDVLPCQKCRMNYKNHLKKYPINNKVLESRDSLTKWLIDIHNEVNHINGKKILSYNEARMPYNRSLESSDLVLIFSIFAIASLILTYSMVKKKN